MRIHHEVPLVIPQIQAALIFIKEEALFLGERIYLIKKSRLFSQLDYYSMKTLFNSCISACVCVCVKLELYCLSLCDAKLQLLILKRCSCVVYNNICRVLVVLPISTTVK